MAARIEKNDEVGAVVAAGSSAGTDGLGVRRSLVQIVHIKIEVELLRYRIVRPGRWLVIERQLEVHLRPRAVADGDPVLLRLFNLPAEQRRIELGQPRRIVGSPVPRSQR